MSFSYTDVKLLYFSGEEKDEAVNVISITLSDC